MRNLQFSAAGGFIVFKLFINYKKMSGTFSIKTLGCKLNQYESSRIAESFINNGWIQHPFGDAVDLVIINTCTVTNRSDKKCRNYIRQGAGFSRPGKVIVTGCMVDSDANKILEMPEVLGTFRNIDKDKIFSLLSQYPDLKESFDSLSPLTAENNDSCGRLHVQSRTRGFVKIQDGCDGACTYCIVPSVRGIPESRKFQEVIEDAKRLIDNGCPELVLTGITIGKYSSDNLKLEGLIKEIIAISGRFRVRITSIEPNHITEELVELLGDKKVCSHLHIPLQSGSDKILSEMRRPYTADDFLRIIDKVRLKNEDISIGTDIIIGFPGESEEDFQNSLDLIKKAEFSYVHQFTYSHRSGTPASTMKRNIPDSEICTRGDRMKELVSGLNLKFRQRFAGRTLPSVIESKQRNKFKAVTHNYIKIILQESELNYKFSGKIADVRLTMADKDKSTGYIVNDLTYS